MPKHVDIDLEFAEPPPWPPLMDPPAVPYEARRYEPPGGGAAQPVLAGRTLLTPIVDLNDYHCSAVIDWIDVCLHTGGEHQARNIQIAAAKYLHSVSSPSTVFVFGPNWRIPYQGKEFFIRIQQPRRIDFSYFLAWLFNKYAARTGRITDLEIMAIEVSIDFRVSARAGASDELRNLQRWQMTDILRRHFRPEAVLTENERSYPRFFIEGEQDGGACFFVDRTLPVQSERIRKEFDRCELDRAHAIALNRAAHHKPPVDRTSYVGERGSSVLVRIMDKRTDRRDPNSGTVVDLPMSEWRSRIEVTLSRRQNETERPFAAGPATVGDLIGHEFQTLRRRIFEFFLPTFSANAGDDDRPFRNAITESEAFERSGVYGLDRVHRAEEAVLRARWDRREIGQRPITLGKKGRLVSYTALNQKADRALKALSKQWARRPSHR